MALDKNGERDVTRGIIVWKDGQLMSSGVEVGVVVGRRSVCCCCCYITCRAGVTEAV